MIVMRMLLCSDVVCLQHVMSHREALQCVRGNSTYNALDAAMLYVVMLYRYEETIRRAEGLSNGHF
jgi:hypothetical protein